MDLMNDNTCIIELQVFSNNKNKRNQVEYFFSSSATENKFVSNGYNNSIRIQSIPNYRSDVKIKAVNKENIKRPPAAILVLYPTIIISGNNISIIIAGTNKNPGIPKLSIQPTVPS